MEVEIAGKGGGKEGRREGGKGDVQVHLGVAGRCSGVRRTSSGSGADKRGCWIGGG